MHESKYLLKPVLGIESLKYILIKQENLTAIYTFTNLFNKFKVILNTFTLILYAKFNIGTYNIQKYEWFEG